MSASVRSSATGARRPSRRRDTTGGADGNQRLTAATGAVLLVLFAAEGVTILAVRQLLTLHFFLGMLLIGPVLLKAGATRYRFIRYYTGAPDYRRKGPPALPLRLLGPFVLLTSLAVVGTGVVLGYAGRDVGLWLFAHKAAFVLWFAVMTIHVLVYVWQLPRLIAGDLRSSAGYRARGVLPAPVLMRDPHAAHQLGLANIQRRDPRDDLLVVLRLCQHPGLPCRHRNRRRPLPAGATGTTGGI